MLKKNNLKPQGWIFINEVWHYFNASYNAVCSESFASSETVVPKPNFNDMVCQICLKMKSLEGETEEEEIEKYCTQECVAKLSTYCLCSCFIHFYEDYDEEDETDGC